MRHDLPVAILAGGLATRLRPITTTVPKVLVEVAGRPFVDHQLALLARHGFRRVVLCVGHLGHLVERHVGNGADWGLDVRFSHDGERLLGTGGALRRALPHLDDVFWVIYGDSYLDFDYARVAGVFGRSGADGLMTVLRNDDRWDASNVVFQDGRLVRYDKRRRMPDMTHIDYGATLLRRAALEGRPADTAWDLADLFTELVGSGRMIGHEVARRFYEIGSPEGLAQTAAHLRQSA